MDVNDFFKDTYNDLLEAAKRITKGHDLAQELLHYSIEEFLNKKNSQDLVQSGAARFYLVRVMMNQWNSSTSYFYKEFKKPSVSISKELEDLADDEDDDDLSQMYIKASKILGDLPWYDNLLFKTYVEEGHTKSSLSRATGIPRTSISLSINRIIKHVKKNL